MARVDGQVVKEGDYVCFKSDIEQSGRIMKIQGDILFIESTRPEGFAGDYIGGQAVTTERAQDCWIE